MSLVLVLDLVYQEARATIANEIHRDTLGSIVVPCIRRDGGSRAGSRSSNRCVNDEIEDERFTAMIIEPMKLRWKWTTRVGSLLAVVGPG